MALLGILIGIAVALIGLANLVVTARARAAMVSMEETVRVLHVSVAGLEAMLGGEIRTTRESADAAAAQATRLIEAFEKMQEGAAVETQQERDTRFAAFNRISAARDLFARAEAESFEKSVSHGGVRGG